MKTVAELEQQLLAAFPRREATEIAKHQCEECEGLRQQLSGTVWTEVPGDFVEAYDGSLPLLTHDAYLAFLPAWLRQAIRNPKGAAAGMLPINLSTKPNTRGFSRAQAAVIVETVTFITHNNGWGDDDPGNIEDLEQVRRIWNNVAV
ncbi:MAG: hypothetical protein L0H94_08025 [Nitrospira sp.]|nr:hypothetical protein [Nitrospira sp.]